MKIFLFSLLRKCFVLFVQMEQGIPILNHHNVPNLLKMFLLMMGNHQMQEC